MTHNEGDIFVFQYFPEFVDMLKQYFTAGRIVAVAIVPFLCLRNLILTRTMLLKIINENQTIRQEIDSLLTSICIMSTST